MMKTGWEIKITPGDVKSNIRQMRFAAFAVEWQLNLNDKLELHEDERVEKDARSYPCCEVCADARR